MASHGHGGFGPRRVYRALVVGSFLYAQVGARESACDIRRRPQLNEGSGGKPPFCVTKYRDRSSAHIAIYSPATANRDTMVWQQHLTVDRPFDDQMLAGGNLAHDLDAPPDRGDDCGACSWRPTGRVDRNGDGRLSFGGGHIKVSGAVAGRPPYATENLLLI